jgi:hypothetical protein
MNTITKLIKSSREKAWSTWVFSLNLPIRIKERDKHLYGTNLKHTFSDRNGTGYSEMELHADYLKCLVS